MKTKLVIVTICMIAQALIINCGRPAGQRKIKLSNENIAAESNQQLTTTIHLEPAKRRSVAVMFFQNKTGDQNLEWLKKGLTEMFIRSLSQSQYLSVLTTDRLFEVLQRIQETSDIDQFDMRMAAIVAKEANVETVLTGSIVKNGDSLQINVKLQDPNRGMVLKEESVEGPGLETLFSMVDNLTQHIKQEMQIALEKGEQERGIAELSTHSLEAWRYYTIGEDFYNKLLINEAMQQFEKAVDADPHFVDAHLRLFNTCIQQRKTDLASRTLRNLESLKDRATVREQYQIDLNEALMVADINTMLKTYQEWLQKFPDDIEANYNAANLYYGLHQYDEAIRYYQRTLEIDPKNKLVMNMLGYTHAQKGDFKQAISWLEKYMKMASDEPNPYDSLGEIYLYLGEYKKAQMLFKKAIKVNDDFYPSWNHLANVYLDRGQYNQARELFQKTLQRVPEGPLEFLYDNSIALTYWRTGQTDKAIELFQRSLDNNLFQSNVFERLFELYASEQDSSKAYAILEQYYQKMVHSPDSTFMNNQNFVNFTNLSFRFGVHVNESLTVLERLYKESESPLTRLLIHLNMLFLYAKAGEKTSFLNAYQQLDQSKFFQLYKEVRQLGYNELWQYLFYLNHFFYNQHQERIEGYQRLIQSAQENDSKMFETGFRLLLADLFFHRGSEASAKQQLQMVGMPKESKWMVIGPFDNTNGFQRKFPPEKKIDVGRLVPYESRILKWQLATDSTQDGYINFREIFHPYNWSVAYGTIDVQSPDEREVEFRVGSNEAVKVWLNGEEIWKINIVRNAVIDDNIVPVTLKKGRNRILVKVCNRTGDWGYYFRITDQEGNGFSNITYSSAIEDVVALK
jgi:tetratricopeptide (TPR) repeat protein